MWEKFKQTKFASKFKNAGASRAVYVTVITLLLAFVFLHEKFTIKSLIGSILIGAGTLVMVI